MKYEIGQKLWWVPRFRGTAYEVKIEKVGRKWIALDNDKRIGVDDLIADGREYTPPGRCYLSKEDWEIVTATNVQWRRLCVSLDMWFQPAGVTLEDIAKVRAILRLPE